MRSVMRGRWFRAAFVQGSQLRSERFPDLGQLLAQCVQRVTLRRHEGIKRLHLIVQKRKARFEF